MSYLYFAAGSILVQGTGLSVLRARKRGYKALFCSLLCASPAGEAFFIYCGSAA